MSMRFPWPFALILIILLAFPMSTATRDMLAQHLNAKAEDQQAQALFDVALDFRRQAAQVNPADASQQLAFARNAQSLWQFRGSRMLQREADVAFEKAKVLSPNWPVPHYDHARMYAFNGQYDRALLLLAPALELDPHNAGYWLERARYLEAQKRIKASLLAYERCMVLDVVPECVKGIDRLKDGE